MLHALIRHAHTSVARGAALALLLGGVPLRAQSPAPEAPFAPMAFLVGHCWTGTFPGGGRTDEHCFTWMHGRRFVRDRHVVRGGAPYEGETVYAWDPVLRRVVFTYWASDGLMGTGTLRPTAAALEFTERYSTTRGPLELRSTWTRTSDTAYTSAVARREGTRWTPLWSMTFVRTRDVGAPDAAAPGAPAGRGDPRSEW